MSEATTATVPPQGSPHTGGRHQRRLRNLLLDRHFQLKYSSYLVLIAVALSVSLGLILWGTSREVVDQSRQNVSHSQRVVSLGKEVVQESRKVSAVVQMNIIKDPVYSDNPALLDAFKRDAETQDRRLESQQRELETQATTLRQASRDLMVFQERMLITLCVVLGVLVIAIGLAGIVVTHKVAGPIHKMKRQIKDVSDGRLKIPSKLRKGDELVDFFETFETMVVNLRRRQEEEIEKLDRAIKSVQGKATDEDLKPLLEVKAEMEAALNV
jgi:nitrogen fixation/metabolism regulation signal transduction histidine kinase